MKYNIPFHFISLFLFSAIFNITSLSARDIDLDAIYIHQKYPDYNRFLEYRLEAYHVAGSRFIDRNIIKVHWLTSHELVYLKEFPGLTIIYRYNLKKGKRDEIARLSGTVTVSSVTRGGRFMQLKRLYENNSPLPQMESCLINLERGSRSCFPSKFPFRDFTLSMRNDAIISEKNSGFSEYYPGADISRLIVPGNRYNYKLLNRNPRLLLQSPDLLKQIIIAGSGGSYRGLILQGNTSRIIQDITSSQEIYWMDNHHIIYRTGSIGNYHVTVRNISTGKSMRLLSGSLNTGIAVSTFSGSIAFLDNQIINLHDLRTGKTVSTGLEGDDIVFSPSGNYFASLIYGKCLISRKDTLFQNQKNIISQVKKLKGMYHFLNNKSQFHINEYSKTYCRKKIRTYTTFINQ